MKNIIVKEIIKLKKYCIILTASALFTIGHFMYNVMPILYLHIDKCITMTLAKRR